MKLVATLRSSTIFLVRRDFSKTNWTFPTVQSERQSAVMERQRRCWGQNLESLITDPPPALLLHLKISDPDTLHSALDPHCTVNRKSMCSQQEEVFLRPTNQYLPLREAFVVYIFAVQYFLLRTWSRDWWHRRLIGRRAGEAVGALGQTLRLDKTWLNMSHDSYLLVCCVLIANKN